MKKETLFCSVLVIGGGAAAIRAAIAARESGIPDVLIAIKSKLGKGGATYYPLSYGWGIQAATAEKDPTDNPDEHYQDIINAAQGMCNPILARALADDAPKRVMDLGTKLGLELDRNHDGAHVQVRGCYAGKERCYQATGVPKIINAVKKSIFQYGLKTLEDVMILDLIVKDGRCCGAFGISKTGEIYTIHAKAVIIATGGGTGIYQYNFATQEMTGDGYALALRAGCKLLNLEFIQFGWGLLKPLNKVPFLDRILFLNPKISGIPPEFIPLLKQRAKHFPFTVSDGSYPLDVAIFKHFRQNHQGISLDISKFTPEDLAQVSLWKMWYEWFDAANDPLKQPLELNIFAHAFNGGILIDENAQTQISGLFAAGEVAAGPHGADRLGGNMHAACQVFGARAGANAAKYAASQEYTDFTGNKIIPDSISPSFIDLNEMTHLKMMIPRLMWENVSVCRSDSSLNIAWTEISKLYRNLPPLTVNPHSWGLYELYNIAQVALAVIGSSLMRKESRGCHYREDFPNKNQQNDMIQIGLNKGEIEHTQYILPTDLP